MKRIVILGGGFGGLLTAIKLAKSKVKAHVILIDKSPEHLYTPWLYKVPADIENQAGEHRTCAFRFKNLLERFSDRIEFRQQAVDYIKSEEKTVHLENGNSLKYDILVIGLGSQPNYFALHKAEEMSHTLSSPDGVREMYAECQKLFEGCAAGSPQHIVIVGGGATGVETACELGYMRKKKGLKNLHISLVDANTKLLARFHPVAQKVAVKRAGDLGLDLHLGCLASEITENQVKLKTASGEEVLNFDLLLWGAGVKPSKAVEKMNLEKTERGRIAVLPTLQTRNNKDIFVIGDNAGFYDEFNEMELPPTAWAAVDQAPELVKNIKRALKGQTLKPYSAPKYYPGVVALGGHVAAGSAYRLPLKGLPGYMLKELIHLHYFLEIFDVMTAFRVWYKKEYLCEN